MAQTEWVISLDDDLKDCDELFVGNIRDGEQLVRCKDCIYHVHSETCAIHFGVWLDEQFCSAARREE